LDPDVEVFQYDFNGMRYIPVTKINLKQYLYYSICPGKIFETPQQAKISENITQTYPYKKVVVLS